MSRNDKLVLLVIALLFGVFIALATVGPNLSLSGNKGAVATGDKAEESKDKETPSGNKIYGVTHEIVEFLWIGCPHCKTLETELAPWLKQNNYERHIMPISPGDRWKNDALLTIAIQRSYGLDDEIMSYLFTERQARRLDASSKESIYAFIERFNSSHNKNFDPERIYRDSKSFIVSETLKRNSKIFEQTGANGVPALLIKGEYLIKGMPAKAMFETIETLL